MRIDLTLTFSVESITQWMKLALGKILKYLNNVDNYTERLDEVACDRCGEKATVMRVSGQGVPLCYECLSLYRKELARRFNRALSE